MSLAKRAIAVLLAFITAACCFTVLPPKANAAFVIDYEPKCDAVYMVNLDTGIVVYEKNAEKQKYPASLTKMMTCLLALEYFSAPESEYVTIKTAVVNDKTINKNGAWSTGFLKEGERVTLKDLLHCALLPSDNQAALAIAYFVAEEKSEEGTLQWFVDRMNEKAAEIGCTNTQFMNPHGLFHEHHYSTAHDLFLIAQYAMQIPYFAEIVNTPVYMRASTNKNDFGKSGARLENTNKMLSTAYAEYYYQYVKGIKTGFIEKASHCFASYATKDGYSYICVCLDDGQKKNKDMNYAMLDTKTLYQWAFSSLDLKEVVSAEKPVVTVDIDLAWSIDSIDLYPKRSFSTLMPSNVEPSSVMVKTHLNDEKVTAPVLKGQVLGTAELIYGSEVIGTIDLVAGETVQRSELLYVLSLITNLFGSTAFIIFIVLLVLFAAGYVVYSLMHARSVNSLKRVHRYRKM